MEEARGRGVDGPVPGLAPFLTALEAAGVAWEAGPEGAGGHDDGGCG